MAHSTLVAAKAAKYDEFYTRIEDIENELSHYEKKFEGKVVFCNCDDPQESNFWKYFYGSFKYLKLKKLISTHYEKGAQSYKLEASLDNHGNLNVITTDLNGDGDFRSEECIEILKEADIVVTNPPFSLFREYIKQLIDYKKEFIILGNPNAVTYKDIFTLIKDNKIWIGFKSWSKDMYFHVNKDYAEWLVENKKEGSGYVIDSETKEVLARVQAIWYTNISAKGSHHTEPLGLKDKYLLEKYPKYDNYNAIEVPTVKKIPKDYYELMGVPITFLADYCPTQFELVGIMTGAKGEGLTNGNDGKPKFYLNQKGVYARVLIKRKREQNEN